MTTETSTRTQKNGNSHCILYGSIFLLTLLCSYCRQKMWNSWDPQT